MHTVTRKRLRGRQSLAAVAAFSAALATAVIVSAPPALAAPTPASTIVVQADQPFRPVTHLASGSLYGLSDATNPSADLIAAIKPHTFVQKPVGGTQQPTGDVALTWKKAADAGAKVVIRLIDYYPGWPYQFNVATWDQVITDQINWYKSSGMTNLAAWAPFNEPDGTWLTSNGSFNDMWVHTYNLIRSLDPTTPIQGPSFSDNISAAQSFFANAKATNTVPDIIEWHELIRSTKIVGDKATIDGILANLGIAPRPISISEYAAPAEVGIPGSLVPYIAKFERLGINDAELPFWNQSGALGDLLTGRGGSPNGAYWLYKWYGDMSGDMVTTTPPDNSNFDAAASITTDKSKVEVITGGYHGPTAIKVAGLNNLAVGSSGSVNVKLEFTPTYGRTVAVSGPITISETTYQVGADGSISVPIMMNPAYGYHIVVTPTGSPASLAGSYAITNSNSGLQLDTSAAGTAAGTLVQQATGSASPSQVWDLVAAGSGLYKIVNRTSGKVLGLQTADVTNSTKIVIADDNGADDHLWQLIPDGKGKYRVANYSSGRVLAVAGMSKDNGAQIVQWVDGAATNACTAAGPRAPGKLGTALNFCNTPAYVSLPTGAVSSLSGDWSISTWVNPASNATWQRVFDIGTSSTASMFFTNNAGSAMRFVITSTGPGGEQQINGTGTLPLNQWSLVTVTVGGTTGKLYVNGNLVGTKTNLTVKPSVFGQSTRNYLGKSQYSSDPAFNGLIDDFNIYNRELTADEVLNYSTGVAGTGNVLKYSFDENTGATVPDSSGNSRGGTVVNGDSAGSGANASTTATDAQTADHFWTLTPVQTDTTAPVVTASVDGRIVTLSATDDDSGVASIEYQLDSGAWTPYTEPITVDPAAHQVSYRATDEAGNTSEVGVVQVAQADVTAPVVTSSVSGRTVTITATDDSGVAGIEYQLDSGAWTPYSEPIIVDFAAHTVSYRATDQAGNVSAVGSVQVAALPLLVTTTPAAPAASGWFTGTVSVSAAATDPSTVKQIQYKIDGGAWTKYTSALAAGQGVHTYGFRILYTSNTYSAQTPITVQRDSALPTGSVSQTTGSPVLVTLAGADAASGVASITYTLDGGAATVYSTPFQVTGSGSHTLTYFVTDEAGNVSATKTTKIAVADTDAPVLTFKTTPGTSNGNDGWFMGSGARNAAITGTDLSGIAVIEYQVNGGAWTTYSGALPMPEGVTTWSYRATDKVGNTSAVGTATTKRDNAAPTVTAAKSGSTVTITATDAVSGVASVTYRLDGGATTAYTGPIAVAAGSHSVVYTASDAAGNTTATKTFTFSVK